MKPDPDGVLPHGHQGPVVEVVGAAGVNGAGIAVAFGRRQKTEKPFS